MQLINHVRTALFHALLMPLLLGVAGCNTVSGVGEDLEAAKSTIEDTAEEKQTY